MFIFFLVSCVLCYQWHSWLPLSVSSNVDLNWFYFDMYIYIIIFTLVTPFIMFSIWLQTVLTAANSFLFPNHFSTLIVVGLGMLMSTARWRNSLVRLPRGPVMVTLRECTFPVTEMTLNYSWNTKVKKTTDISAD